MPADQTTAHIETLTATVHCLMIGKRQVTLSVYRQLDTVEPHEIEPMGRVRDAQDDPHGMGGVHVVGQRTNAGHELVRSRCYKPVPPGVCRPIDAPDGLLTRHQNLGQRDEPDTDTHYPRCTCFAALGREHILVLHAANDDRIAWYPPRGTGAVDPVDVELVEDVAVRQLDTRRAQRAIHDDWAALPLIVLAGLR